MDFDKLRYFIAVADAKGMRAAATKLNISAAAISKAVKLLEEELEVELLIAAGRGIELTDKGKKLAQRGRLILKSMEALKKDIRHHSETREVLRIGSFVAFNSYFVGSFLEQSPLQPELILYEHQPSELEVLLENDLIDFTITYDSTRRKNLESIPAANLKTGIFGRASDFAHLNFSEYPFVVPTTPVREAPTRTMGSDGWPDDPYPRTIKYHVMSMDCAFDLCRRGIAVGHFPRFLVHLHNQKVHSSAKLDLLPSPVVEDGQTDIQVFLTKRRSLLDSPYLNPLLQALNSLQSDSNCN